MSVWASFGKRCREWTTSHRLTVRSILELFVLLGPLTIQKMKKASKNDPRPQKEISEHYEIEKKLAARLRNSSSQDRALLYSSLYDELYRRIPHHPQNILKASAESRKKRIKRQVKFLSRLLGKNQIFLEVGPGDCALSFEVSKLVKKVYAVDVSEVITKRDRVPGNFQLILSDGRSIPVPAGSANVAYSNQLIEHLHPGDAIEHLNNVYNSLAPGGVYVCITPNRLNGPHDISRFFDTVATGFHLKEYTITELSNLLNQVGFSKVRKYIGGRGIYIGGFPLLPFILTEEFLGSLPKTLTRTVARSLLFRILLNNCLVGYKNPA